MEPFVLIIGIALAFGVAAIGSNRRIGFLWALFWSLILGPLIGLIITLCSGKKKVEFDEVNKDE